MRNFVFEKIPKVYFGGGSLKQALSIELSKVGKNVMITYGGEAIKKNGVYDELKNILLENDKNIIDFDGIMSNPTYKKVQEGAKVAKENNVDLIIAVGGGSVIDCSKIISAQAKLDEDIWKMEFEKGKFPKEFIKMAAVVTASGTGAEIVRQIFNRYCEGAGSTIIARELTEAGYIPPKGGKKWAESTIRGIIKNEKYKGDVLQGKTFTIDPITHKRMVNKGEEDKYYIENNHEAIVSAETYEKAQRILEKRSGAVETGRRKGNYSRKYTFSSRIFCGFCGSVFVRRNLYINTKHETKVWQCMNYAKKGKKICLETKAIREKIIEDCFVEAYELLCQDNKEVINNFLNRIDGFLRENNTKSILQKLEVKKQGIENKINSLINLMIDGTIDKETFNKKKKENRIK